MLFFRLTLLRWSEQLAEQWAGVWGATPSGSFGPDMAESDNILTKLHDLLLYVISQINRFPHNQCFVLGGRIVTKVLET